MIEATAKISDHYLADFDRHQPARGPAWLQKIRADAISKFSELGFPTGDDEDWRFTPVEPLAEIPFELVTNDVKNFCAKEALEAGHSLVFVNGQYVSESGKALPAGVHVGNLASALKSVTGRVEPYLARHADYQTHAFTAMNTAFMNDGAFVYLPKGTVVDQPIFLVFVTTPGEKAMVSYPRILVVAEAGARATIVESYLGEGKDVYFTNAVTEIVVAEDAAIEHYKLQQENGEAFHVATIQVHQGRNSHVTSHSLSFGGALARNDINFVLDGEGSECTLNGLYVAAGRQHVDHHTSIDHVRPHASSRELYKGILAEQARGVFNGKIVVRQDAQKTDAMQTNKNLLLSAEALIHTKPQLEIFANDVKCKHGATVGQIDPDAIFYLRARGLDESTARSILTMAFAQDVVGRMACVPMQTAATQSVSRLLRTEVPS